MLANLFDDMGGRGVGALIGLILGSVITGCFAYWRRVRERRRVMRGDARDTVVIHQHILEPGTPPVLRIRCLGQGELRLVVPNTHLATILLRRAEAVTTHDTLISMVGAEGSYLLETLTGFVCDRVGNEPFDHDLFVMAPCCEPAGLAEHQPITVILVAVQDLAVFESWPACRRVRVEHGADGVRVLTLMALARRFRDEQEQITKLRQTGQRTRYHETMYVLDLALDKRSAPVPTKEIPWGRFESVLRELNLE